MNYLSLFSMWLAMTAIMMAPVVYPWLRALNRVAAVGEPGSVVAPEVTGGRATPRLTLAGAHASSAPRVLTSVTPFLGGYMVAWAGFSAVAAAVHFTLVAVALPVPLGAHAPTLSAAALILTGAFQLTKLKEACLSHCRSPAGFLLSNWKPGAAGHTRMGLEHGLHCVGCCWALMALALVVGMANLIWMGLLMAVMVAETALPFGARLSRPIGVALIAAGVATFFT